MNESQFRELISVMGLLNQDEEVDYLLNQIDPYKNNRMTYSEVVQLLSSHMVPGASNPSGPPDSIPILEKFSLASGPGSSARDTESLSPGVTPIPIIDQMKQIDNQPSLYPSAQPAVDGPEIHEEVGKNAFSVGKAASLLDEYGTGASLDQQSRSSGRHVPPPGQETEKAINDITNMQRFTAFAGPAGNEGMHAHRPDQLSR